MNNEVIIQNTRHAFSSMFFAEVIASMTKTAVNIILNE